MDNFRDMLRTEMERSSQSDEEILQSLYTLREFMLMFEEQYGVRDPAACAELVAEIHRLENR